MHRICRAFIAGACLILAACGTTVQTGSYPPIEPRSSTLAIDLQQRSWWQLRFKLNWPEDESPDFSAHLLLAEQILLPVILEHEQQLPLWRFHRRGLEDLATIEETSDREWPQAIQRSWPWFIMGASQSWLMQVQQISEEEGLSESMEYAILLEHYRDVALSMNNQWRDFGQHAYFHHLSALYGYQPVKVRTTELRQF